jgi:hypothetical protein
VYRLPACGISLLFANAETAENPLQHIFRINSAHNVAKLIECHPHLGSYDFMTQSAPRPID